MAGTLRQAQRTVILRSWVNLGTKTQKKKCGKGEGSKEKGVERGKRDGRRGIGINLFQE